MSSPSRAFLPLLSILLPGLALFFVSCDDEDLPDLPSFYLEMDSAFNPLDTPRELTMPNSGLTYFVFEEPVIPAYYIKAAELVKVESGHLALRFYFDREGTRDLYRTSVTNMGRMLITVVDGKPIGARQLDGAIEGGIFYTFTDLTEEELMELVPKMQESILKLNRLKAKQS